MIPGMNPREVQKAMKRLGIRQEEIDAQEVIIRTADKDLVIHNPQVSKVNMMGQETFQIVGEVTEVDRNENAEISDEDVATVMEQTNSGKDEAFEALAQCSGNLAEAILKLQKK